MKKKIKIILIIAIVLIVGFFLVMFTPLGFVVAGKLEKGQMEKASVLYQKMVETGEFNFCEKTKGAPMMSSTSYKDTCVYGYIALYAKNLEACEIEGIKNTWHYTNRCYRTVALNTGDTSSCKKLNNNQVESCILEVKNKYQSD